MEMVSLGRKKGIEMGNFLSPILCFVQEIIIIIIIKINKKGFSLANQK
jgi:hypothetical protein